MKESSFRDWGLLGLRVVLALIFIYHGYPKAVDWAMASAKFEAMGFAGFLGPIVGVAEVALSVAILTGVRFRLANLGLAVIILVAILGVQIPGAERAGKFLTAGLERDLLIFVGHLALIGTGAGNLVLVKGETCC